MFAERDQRNCLMVRANKRPGRWFTVATTLPIGKAQSLMVIE